MTYITMKIIDGIPDQIAEANCAKKMASPTDRFSLPKA